MLLSEIEKKREQLIRTAEIHGLTSSQVLKCSKELDEMIHLYLKKQQQYAKRPKKHFILFRPSVTPMEVPVLKK